MLGLFGTLDLANRSLQIQRQGTEVAGHNIANVNNPAYARQRLQIQSSPPLAAGQTGAGVSSATISQIRDALLDRQIQSETSVRGSLTSQQRALQFAQAALGQEIQRQNSSVDAASSTGTGGISEALAGFFNAFQSLATNPTSSAERQILASQASALTMQFHQTSARLDNLDSSLQQSLRDDVLQFNTLLSEVADLTRQIIGVERDGFAPANDLRDLRQQKLEALATIAGFDLSEGPRGALSLSVAGVELIDNDQVLDTLAVDETDPAAPRILAASAAVPLNLTSGSILGTLQVKAGAVADLRGDLDQLAGFLISEVNALHEPGFGANNSTGQPFFTGTDARTIQLNPVLANDSSLIQTASRPDEPGNGDAALRIAQLASTPQAALGNQTASQFFNQTVTALGQSLSLANQQIETQELVENMLKRQRDSISGVSLDEEMTDLLKFQKAFDASARLIVTIDEMLNTVLGLKR